MLRPVSMAVLTALCIPAIWLAAACARVDPDQQFVLDAPCDEARSFAGLDRLTRADDRLETRTAQPVHRLSGDIDW